MRFHCGLCAVGWALLWVSSIVRAGEAGRQAIPSVRVVENDAALDLLSRGRQVLRYHKAMVPPPESADPKYARSAFVHPLLSPAGAVLTRIHAKDHIHHMGLWNAWTSIEFEGRKVDCWNLRAGSGAVRFAKVLSRRSTPDFAEFVVQQEHVDLSAPGGQKIMLLEELQLRLWSSSESRPEGYLIDWVSRQRCASESAVKLLQYRYGGLGYRGPEEWDKPNSEYLSSEGKTRKDGHATRSRWCNVYGQTVKGPAGILFMSHPQNREHPEPMRIWPEGQVFFNYAPIQQKEWVLEPGNDYVLRYRLYVYDGQLTREQCQKLWADFAASAAVPAAQR